MKLTFPHKHIKNTSNVKQFSLKTNWQKDSYSQGYKKIHTELERKGKQSGQDLGPWERIQMKMEITQADTCPGEGPGLFRLTFYAFHIHYLLRICRCGALKRDEKQRGQVSC